MTDIDPPRDPSGWISVKDRLPAIGEVVDVWNRRRKARCTDASIEYLGDNGEPNWCCSVYFFDEEVTHWRPVPSPPE